MRGFMLRFVAIFLSFTLFISGCSNKNQILTTPSGTVSPSSGTHLSTGERIASGALVVGMAAIYLTSIAVAILLLVPKDPYR